MPPGSRWSWWAAGCANFSGPERHGDCKLEAESNWALRGRLLSKSSREVVGRRPGGLVQSSSMTSRWQLVARASEALTPGCGSVEGALDKQQGYLGTLGAGQEHSPLQPSASAPLAWASGTVMSLDAFSRSCTTYVMVLLPGSARPACAPCCGRPAACPLPYAGRAGGHLTYVSTAP